MRELIDNLSSSCYTWNICDQWSVSSALDINNESSSRALFGGGGLVLPDQKGANTSNNTYWQINIPSQDYKDIQKPYYGAAIGFNWFKYCSIPTYYAQDALSAFTNYSSFLGLRNRGSIESFTSLNIDKSKLSWLPCPSTLIRTCVNQGICANTLLGVSFDSHPGKKIGINFALDRLDQRGLDLSDFQRLGQFLDVLKGRGFQLEYIAHKDQDLRFIDLSNVVFDNVHNISSLPPKDIVQLYCSFDLILGGRGHSLMIPFGLGVPIISLTTHDKQRYFMEDCGLSNFQLPINDFNLDHCIAVFDKLYPMIDQQALMNNNYQSLGLEAWKNFTYQFEK